MSGKARITADFATPRDVASRLRIPAKRAAELRDQVYDLQLRNPDGSVVTVEFKSPRLAPRKNTKRSGVRLTPSKKK
jgi:hypothetical protein